MLENINNATRWCYDKLCRLTVWLHLCRWYICPVLAPASACEFHREEDAGAGDTVGIWCQPQVPQQEEQPATEDAQVLGRKCHCAGGHHLPCADWDLHGDGWWCPHSVYLRYIRFFFFCYGYSRIIEKWRISVVNTTCRKKERENNWNDGVTWEWRTFSVQNM